MKRSIIWILLSFIVNYFPGPCLYESGLVTEKLTYREDYKCLDYKIGMTNIVERTTRAASDLSK